MGCVILNIKISIVTVTYNAVSVLKETIDSIVEQRYGNVELIVVDGLSNDGTVELIEENKSLISKYISEKDSGIYDAMNKGVKLATGDYIIFMNAGDYFCDENSISNSIVYLEKNLDVVYGNKITINSRCNNGLNIAQDINNIIYGMVCSHQSMFFKRTKLIDYPFSLEYGTAGDYECICRLYKSCSSFLRINHVISFYSAGGVSDIKRTKSVYYSYLAAKNNGLLTFKSFFIYVYKYVRAFLSQYALRLNGQSK